MFNTTAVVTFAEQAAFALMVGRKRPREVALTGADRQDTCLLWMLSTCFFLPNVIFTLKLLLLLKWSMTHTAEFLQIHHLVLDNKEIREPSKTKLLYPQIEPKEDVSACLRGTAAYWNMENQGKRVREIWVAEFKTSWRWGETIPPQAVLASYRQTGSAKLKRSAFPRAS